MKGLLLKDLYTLLANFKRFALILVIWMLIPGFSGAGIAVVYACLLPITALAYDERAKWNELAAGMPYTDFDMVFSKYLLGWILVVGVGILGTMLTALTALVRSEPITRQIPLTVIMTAGLGLILLAINLPFMFRFGVEKGRFVFYGLFAGAAMLLTLFQDRLTSILSSVRWEPAVVAVSLIAAAVVLNALSAAVSVKIFQSAKAR